MTDTSYYRDGELGIEDDESYWYPLWPDAPGRHPWE